MLYGVGAKLSDRESAALRWAYQHLEHPSLATRLSSRLASPIREGLALLPTTWREDLEKTAELNISQSLRLAITALDSVGNAGTNNGLHKSAAVSADAAGGFLGPLTLVAELPLTTVPMLRSIADIARSEGENLSQKETRLACVQVFALGGRTREIEDADTEQGTPCSIV